VCVCDDVFATVFLGIVNNTGRINQFCLSHIIKTEVSRISEMEANIAVMQTQLNIHITFALKGSAKSLFYSDNEWSLVNALCV
jgi:hypothetical protein